MPPMIFAAAALITPLSTLRCHGFRHAAAATPLPPLYFAMPLPRLPLMSPPCCRRCFCLMPALIGCCHAVMPPRADLRATRMSAARVTR